MPKPYTMNKKTYVRYAKKGFPPKCRNCEAPIKVGDDYVRVTYYGGAIRKVKPKLYCIPCADMLNII